MDDLSGWQTAALVRQQYSAAHLPIVIVSADLFENQPEQLERAGCQAFVGKPVLESELMDTLAWLLKLEWIEDMAEPAPPQRHHRARRSRHCRRICSRISRAWRALAMAPACAGCWPPPRPATLNRTARCRP